MNLIQTYDFTKKEIVLTKAPPRVVGEMTDQYGEKVVIHKTRHGIRKMRTELTPAVKNNQAVAPFIAQKIHALRKANGLSLLEFAHRLGWTEGNAKQRAWHVENGGARGEGVRLGTLYHIANTFGVDIATLIPSMEEFRCA